MKNSFILYYDYATHFELLSDEELGKLLRAIMRYEKDGSESEIGGMVKMAFSFIKKQLDDDKRKYEEKCDINKANALKGGRPKLQAVAESESNRTDKNESENNRTDNENNRTVIAETERLKTKPKKPDNDNDNDNDITIKESVREKAFRFSPPTVGEVETFCSEQQIEVDANRFVNFYESKGWLVGKVKMKDWKAALRGWESRNNPTSKPTPKKTKWDDRVD
ncbi:MAG: DUF6291 domain-containing protein [Clostridia bacterium]